MNLVIMQARMGSSRLPGKVLKQVCGRTLLELQYERIQAATMVDRIIIATTTNLLDESIVDLCKQRNIEYFRGSENDVLDRYYQTAQQAEAVPGDAIIRVTADCPLLDPEVLDQVIDLFWSSGVDYASNINPPTFPDGLDVEIFKYEVLERAWQEASLTSEREHVTPYLRNHPEIFSQANYFSPIDLSGLRLTVDEPEDLEIVRAVYEQLYMQKRIFLLVDIMAFLDANPHLLAKNQGITRNAGYEKSLHEDKVVRKGMDGNGQ